MRPLTLRYAFCVSELDIDPLMVCTGAASDICLNERSVHLGLLLLGSLQRRSVQRASDKSHSTKKSRASGLLLLRMVGCNSQLSGARPNW